MRHVLAVTLKSPDPAAITALGALRGFMEETAPVKMLRYDLWGFESDEGREALSGIIAGYPDILNPNKQRGLFLDGALPPLPRDGTVWTGIRVEDVSSGASESWTTLLARGGGSISSVDLSVLWVLGYPAGTDAVDAAARAWKAAVACDRSHGLLANPISQRAIAADDGGGAPQAGNTSSAV